MEMEDEELLKLYAADQEERKQFALLPNGIAKEKMRVTIHDRDMKRRELVDDLMTPANSPIIKNPANCFLAATIYSRGDSTSDRKKANMYAKKACFMIKLLPSHFVDLAIKLNQDTEKRLLGDEPLSTTPRPTPRPLQNTPQTPLKKQLDFKKMQQRKAEELEHIKDLGKAPRCFACGRPHNGPCPPK